MSHQCDYSLLDTLYLVFVFFHVLWYLLLPPINEVWGKVIFSVACVKNSVHRGGLPQCMLGYPLGPGTPRSRNPLDQAPPQSSACWEIRSTSGQYASYWNAILFFINLHPCVNCIFSENNFKMFTRGSDQIGT